MHIVYRRGDYAAAVNFIGGDGRSSGGDSAVGRVSSNKLFSHLAVYVYFSRHAAGYVQLLVFYSGMYTLEIVSAPILTRFSAATELYRTGADAEYLRTPRKFSPGDSLGAAR